jgi:hypothetical protein
MATLSPFGLQSCDTRTSSPWNAKANQTYQINPTYTTPLYDGDVVTIIGGYIALYTGVQQPAGTTPVPPLGVFRGCNYNQINATGYNVPFFRSWNGINDVVAGTPVYAVVEDDINNIYKVQSNQALGVNVTSTYQNALLVVPATPNDQVAPNANPNLTSTMAVGPAVAGNANYDVKIVGIFDAANGGAYNSSPTLNQWSTATNVCPYPILLVQFNNHLTRAGTAGAE